MFVEYEGTVPKRCLYCGGLMIQNTKHQCITTSGITNKSVFETVKEGTPTKEKLTTGQVIDKLKVGGDIMLDDKAGMIIFAIFLGVVFLVGVAGEVIINHYIFR